MQINKVQMQPITDSAMVILCSFLSVIAAELLAYFLLECWRDQLVSLVAGGITYLCLQILTLFRYTR